MEKYWWFKTEWHQQMIKALQVNGKGERTGGVYPRHATACRVLRQDAGSYHRRRVVRLFYTP